MKRLLTFCLIIFVFAAQAQTNISVIYSFISGLGVTQQVKQASFTPIYNAVLGQQIIAGDESFRVIPTSGYLTNSWMLSGMAYRVKFFSSTQPPTVSTTFTNYFPTNLSGEVYASLYVTGSTNLGNGAWALTKAYADTLYQSIGSTPSISTNRFDFLVSSTNSQPWKEGRIYYDQPSHTLAYFNDRSNVTVNIGQEQQVRVMNQTGSTITNGSAVTFTTGTGSIPRIALAQSTTNITSSGYDCVGLTTEDIAQGGEGIVTTVGIVHGINTDSWLVGTTVYLSTNAGAYTTNPPPSNYARVVIGSVSRGNANNGDIFVFPQQAVHAADISGLSSLGYLTNNQTGVTLTGAFGGNGSGLTNIPAASIVGGISGSTASNSFAPITVTNLTAAQVAINNIALTNLTATFNNGLTGVVSVANNSASITIGNTNTATGGGVTNGQVIYVPVLKVWPDVVWGLGDSKSCEFRTNANTWSVHGGYSNPLAISLYPPYTTNNGIFTYTNGAPSTVVTNGGSWMVYFTNRMATNFGKATALNNSLAQSGLQMGAYLGTTYVVRGTKWIPPYTDPNGGDPLLYMATNTLYSGRPWVLVHGGQNDIVSTNAAGLWQTMTNLYAALRAQGKIVVGSTITITPTMFQVPATPNWSQLTAIGTNVLNFNSLLMSNQWVCDAVVDVQSALSNRVTSGTGWVSGMTTNWWDGTHPIDQEADWEASVWVNTLDTNSVFWASVASYQSPSYQLTQWSKINPTNLNRYITNMNATPFTNDAIGQFADTLTVKIKSVSPRLNVGGNNDAIVRVGGTPSDSDSAIFGMAGGGSYWFNDAAGGETVVYAKPGFQILLGDGNAGGRRASLRISDKLVTSQTNLSASWSITATNGFVCPSNTWNIAFTNGMGLGDWRFGNSNGIPMKVWLTPAGSWIWSTNF